MLPDFLFPETAVTGKDGEGPGIPLGDAAGKIVKLTLGITEIIEQESLDVRIHGSAGGTEWGAKPMAEFPQKFYKGISTILLDLGAAPEVTHLKVKYKMNRWGHWKDGPMFRFYVFAETLRSALLHNHHVSGQ
jgi:hypothetical protein